MLSKLYRGWQMNMKEDLQDEVQKAIAHYIKKHGNPPAIIEHSNKLKMPKMDVEFVGIRIPDNILLLGE